MPLHRGGSLVESLESRVLMAATAALDHTFANSGFVKNSLGAGYNNAKAVAVQSDGRVLIAGESLNQMAVIRYNTDGTLDDGGPMLWGGELILRNGEPAGELRSAAYGHSLGCAVGLGLVESADGVDQRFLGEGRFEIDVAGMRHAAKPHLKPAYDPKGEKIRPPVPADKAA